MEWVETTGRTIEEAKDQALDRLGVDEADAEFDVLEEPRPGLFGRMRGEARVRARVRPTQPRPKAERRDRRKRTEPTNGPTDDAEAAPAETGPTVATAEPDVVEPAAADDDDAPAEAPAAVAAAPRRAPRTTTAKTPPAPVVASETGDGVSPGQAGADFLIGLASAFGAKASTEIIELEEGDVEVRLVGDDLGLLIGPRGQTLQAVQDLTRLSVQRNDEGRHGRLRIDIAGYRERRREALGRFTEQVVAQVIATGEPRALEPMSAPDRKVVHDVANGIDGVTTRSEGEDPFRRVIVLPVED